MGKCFYITPFLISVGYFLRAPKEGTAIPPAFLSVSKYVALGC